MISVGILCKKKILYSTTHKIFRSDALRCTHLLSPALAYYAANPHSLALQEVVEVNAMEEGHQHSESLSRAKVR